MISVGDMTQPTGMKRCGRVVGGEGNREGSVAGHRDFGDGDLVVEKGGVEQMFSRREVDATGIHGVLSQPPVEGFEFYAVGPSNRGEAPIGSR